MDKTMQQAYQRTLEVFVESAPKAAEVPGLTDITQSFFYCGAGTVFKVLQHRTAVKVEAGANAVVALMETFDEVAREIAVTAREHEAALLARRARIEAEGAANG